MPKTTDSVIFSEIEREILETALQSPELSNSEIADRTGARLTLVRDTRRAYEDEVELSEAAAEAAEAAEAAAPPAGVDDADLSETQVAILEAIQADPTLSNAEVADRTGARMTLVRDTRAEYGEAVTTAGPAGDADADDDDPTAATDDRPSETQATILEMAAAEPELSNAEIADRTNNRITLVRDTLQEFDIDAPADTGTATDSATSVDAGLTPEADTDALSETQVEIIETARENPESTNAEIAERTGSRITLVRDTVREYESDSDGANTGSDTGGTDMESDTEADSGREDVLADVDTDAFSATQLDVLETALRNPELTNAEIAEQTGTRITFVRDTRFDHEYDEKPWVGNLEDPGDDEADDDAADESTTTSSEPDELPETTASELLSAAERAILEAALDDPALTNAEIAEETGTRIALVRDTRRTYEDAVDLAESTDDAADESTTTSSEPDELPETTASELLSAAERAILEAALDDPALTNAEIAEETGTRIALVRDTRRTYEDAVDPADGDESTGATATDSVAESIEPDSAESAGSADHAGGSTGGLNTGVLIALLIGLLVVLVLVVSVL